MRLDEMKQTQQKNLVMPTDSAQIAFVGFVHRMRIYFREMFPLLIRITNSTLLFVSFTAMLGIVCDISIGFDWRLCFLGSFNAFAVALILRLMDELKDRDIDRSLFNERPVPSGRVRETDIKFCLAFVVVIFVMLNVVAQVAFWSAFGLLVYCCLMFKYFFLPARFKSKLLINLLTHNPIIPLLLLHFVHLIGSWYSLDSGALFKPQTILLVLMYWGLFLSWEICRKIRYRHEENEYVTYSRILGRAPAILAVGLVNKFSLAAGLWISFQYGLSQFYDVVLLIGFAILAVTYTQFLRHKLNNSKQLKNSAELYAFVVMLAPLLNIVMKGVADYVFS
jgi:4-hydroxybenzoate polyprenyltransferase